jgi:two-component system response regulator DegU
VKILVVDDHDLVRQGLRSLLAVRPDWEICGEARTGDEAVQAVADLKPDLVILDITMPGISGLEAATRIRALGTAVRILILPCTNRRGLRLMLTKPVLTASFRSRKRPAT